MLGIESDCEKIEENTFITEQTMRRMKIQEIDKENNPELQNRLPTGFKHNSKVLKNAQMRNFKKRLKQIEETQIQMQEYYKGYLQKLENQLSRKQQHNQKLENCVSTLKKEINEEENDLEILKSYMEKNKLLNPTNYHKSSSSFNQSKQMKNKISRPSSVKQKRSNSIYNFKRQKL